MAEVWDGGFVDGIEGFDPEFAGIDEDFEGGLKLRVVHVRDGGLVGHEDVFGFFIEAEGGACGALPEEVGFKEAGVECC